MQKFAATAFGEARISRVGQKREIAETAAPFVSEIPYQVEEYAPVLPFEHPEKKYQKEITTLISDIDSTLSIFEAQPNNTSIYDYAFAMSLYELTTLNEYISELELQYEEMAKEALLDDFNTRFAALHAPRITSKTNDEIAKLCNITSSIATPTYDANDEETEDPKYIKTLIDDVCKLLAWFETTDTSSESDERTFAYIMLFYEFKTLEEWIQSLNVESQSRIKSVFWDDFQARFQAIPRVWMSNPVDLDIQQEIVTLVPGSTDKQEKINNSTNNSITPTPKEGAPVLANENVADNPSVAELAAQEPAAQGLEPGIPTDLLATVPRKPKLPRRKAPTRVAFNGDLSPVPAPLVVESDTSPIVVAQPVPVSVEEPSAVASTPQTPVKKLGIRIWYWNDS